MNNNNLYDILVIRDYYPSINNPSSSTWVYNQVLEISQMGYNPFVISPTPINPLKNVFKKRFHLYDVPTTNIDIYKNTKVIRPPYIKIPYNKMIGITLKQLSKCISKYGDIDSLKLIHAHFGQNGVASLKLKKELNIPLITSFYGYDTGRLADLYKPYYKNLIREGDLFLALSNDMKNDLLNLGFPERKVIIHHLGIDLNTFNHSTIKKEKFTILTVARLDKVKGIEFVLQALYLFFNKYPKEKNKIQYRIIGGGKYEKELISMTKKLKLNENVVFINNLINPNSRQIVIEEMKNCDLFILCSYTLENGAKEGTPVVLMEAQACGKPCIATFHAGIPEIVKNNETGILVNEKSPEEISRAIEKLYFNKEMRLDFGKRARDHINKEFNQEIQMEKLAQIYHSLINKG